MSIEKEFVPYQESLLLKELGFDEPCFGCFNHLDKSEIWTNRTYMNGLTENITAPTFSQAFRWFRENHGLNYEIPYAGKDGEYHAFVKDYIYGNNRNSPSVFTYEEAELECLRKLIEITKEKQHDVQTN